MLNQDIVKEFLFDCQMRKLSERTIKSYKNNNLKMLHFIRSEYGITELEETITLINSFTYEEVKKWFSIFMAHTYRESQYH